MGIAFATAAVLSFSTVYAQEPVWDGNKVELASEKLDDGEYALFD